MSALPVEEGHLYLPNETGEMIPWETTLVHALKRIEALEDGYARFELLHARQDTTRDTYARRDELEDIFGEWQEVCRHKRARLDAVRFDAIRFILEVREPGPYPRAAFSAAFAGAAFDAFTVTRKNGDIKRFDDVSLICRDATHFEDFIQRRPKENTHGPSA